MANRPHITILGAGPAGLGAAYQLARLGRASVEVIEQSDKVGGNAGSFDIAGIQVDYGSHRLHPSCDQRILEDIKELIGKDLLNRPRHGRIRLRNRWVHFPLKAAQLSFELPPSFIKGTALDLIYRALPRKSLADESESFASILEQGLGKTICQEFYYPYATKIWGLPPEELSASQARRRVSAGSIKKLILKVLSSVPGFRTAGSGRFFYPRRGFGQICEALYSASEKLGVKFFLGAKIDSIKSEDNYIVSVGFEKDGQAISKQADHLWSTIPIPELLNYLTPPPPSVVLRAATNLDCRAMILTYLVLDQNQFSEYDAHYFPEADIPITRLSEPKNYSNIREPRDRTILCAELPCSIESPEWRMSDEELGDLVLHSLKSAAIPIESDVTAIFTRRLHQAYPIYKRSYEVYFNGIDQWLELKKNLITFGRQGLFAHDNTHHALYMAYSAVKCLKSNGHFDHARWQTFRRVFDTHVVED